MVLRRIYGRIIFVFSLPFRRILEAELLERHRKLSELKQRYTHTHTGCLIQ